MLQASRKKLYFNKRELIDWLLHNPIKTKAEIEQEADDYIVNGKKGGQNEAA